jgi:CMP/dCMP kinase
VSKRFTVSIDGVSGAGKGTLSKMLADHFKCEYLPTGNLYRGVARACLEHGEGSDISNSKLLEIAGECLGKNIHDDQLKPDEISKMSSVIAKKLELRKLLNEFQRNWIAQREFSIVEGRDIGTKICPEADVKIYLTADPKIRAERRYKELVKSGAKPSFEDVYRDLKERDKRDSERECSPLRRPEGAYLLNTDALNIDQMVMQTIGLVEKKLTNR